MYLTHHQWMNSYEQLITEQDHYVLKKREIRTKELLDLEVKAGVKNEDGSDVAAFVDETVQPGEPGPDANVVDESAEKEQRNIEKEEVKDKEREAKRMDEEEK